MPLTLLSLLLPNLNADVMVGAQAALGGHERKIKRVIDMLILSPGFLLCEKFKSIFA